MTLLSTLSLTFLVLTVVGGSPVLQIRDSPISVPIAARINATGGSRALLEADRARFAMIRAQTAQHARGLEARKQVPVPVANAGVSYVCEVGVGNPPTSYALIVDTGSSNTWVGATKPYVPSSTSHKTPNAVAVQYGSGNFSGHEFTDDVKLGAATIKGQSIGVADTSFGFQGVDGILGIGPVDLTVGTLSPDTSSSIPTVTDSLKSRGLTSAASVGISFVPTTELNAISGELDFGGTDHSKFIGPIHYVDVTDIPQSSSFWGITQTVSYGFFTPIIDRPYTAGIVDTGTTLLLIPSDAFQRYQTATGGVMDEATGLLRISAKQFAKLESLFFYIGDSIFEFTPNAQLWPRKLNGVIGGVEDAIYLIVASSGVTEEQDPTAVQFLNGFVWLQRFYSVYDTDHHRIGFAKTRFTDAKTN